MIAILKRIWTCRHTAAGALIQWSGAARAYEVACRPEGAIILMYHSVSDGSTDTYVDPTNRMALAVFERQMAFLHAHRQVLSLSAVVEMLNRGQSPPGGSVCITFDDGYLDNLTIAAPVLARYRLPATLFLATGYVERGEPQWSDELHGVWQTRTVNRLCLPGLGLGAVDLSSAEGTARARKLLHRALLETGHEERTEWLDEIKKQLKPKGSFPRLTLNWDEARALLRSYPFFEIGGHTRDHIDLRTHADDVAQREIDACAADIRRELSLARGHFSFPYGRWRSGVRDLVSTSGWRSAVGAGPEVRIGSASDPFAMPRVQAPSGMTSFRFVTSAAFPGALSILGLRR